MKTNVLKVLDGEIWDRIHKMQLKTIEKLIKDCEEVTSTNCSWTDFGLSKSIKDMAEAVIKSRKVASRSNGE